MIFRRSVRVASTYTTTSWSCRREGKTHYQHFLSVLTFSPVSSILYSTLLTHMIHLNAAWLGSIYFLRLLACPLRVPSSSTRVPQQKQTTYATRLPRLKCLGLCCLADTTFGLCTTDRNLARVIHAYLGDALATTGYTLRQSSSG